MNDGQQGRRHPMMMYQDGMDAIAVQNTDEEEAARLKGFDELTAGMMSNKQLSNWFWDLEDLSPKQLVVFAQEEYGVDLPVGASQEKLFQAVCKLTRAAPYNKNRIVLMAHTVKLNYDATLAEIKKAVDSPGEGYEVETEEWEFVA